MSRVATATIRFEADTSPADATFNAWLAKVQSRPVTMNFAGGNVPASPGWGTAMGTLGGQSVPGGVPSSFGIGSASPNLSFFSAQLARDISQSISGAVSQALQSASRIVSQQMPASPVASVMAAAGPSSQQLAIQAALNNAATISPNLAAALGGPSAQMMWATGGNAGVVGGAPTGRQRVFGRNISQLASGMFAYHEVDNAIRAYQGNQRAGELLGRGEIDEAISSEISRGEGLRGGLIGMARKSMSWMYSPLGLHYYDDEENLETLRGAKLGREAQHDSDTLSRRTANATFQQSQIGRGTFDRAVADAAHRDNELDKELSPSRMLAAKLAATDPSTSKVLTTEIARITAATSSLGASEVAEAGRVRSVEGQSVDRSSLRFAMIAAGDTRGAARKELIDKYDEQIAKEKDPWLQSGLMINKTLGVNSYDVEERRAQSLRNISYASSTAANMQLARGDTFGAGLTHAMAAAQTGVVSAQGPLDKFQAALQGLTGVASYVATANRQTALSTAAITGQGQVYDLQSSHQPLAAQLQSIQNQRNLSVASLGALSTPALQQQAAAIFSTAASQSTLARTQFVDQSALVNRSQQTQYEQLGYLMRDPNRPNYEGARAAGTAGSAMVEAMRFKQQGMYGEAYGVLDLGLEQLKYQKQEYSQSFRGSAVDLRAFDTTNPRNTEDTGEAMKSIDKKMDDLITAIKNLVP